MKDRLLAVIILAIVIGMPIGMMLYLTLTIIMDFVFLWPFFMSGVWITGGLYFWFRHERHMHWERGGEMPPMRGTPLVSILIPSYNESKNILETVSAAAAQRYSNFEILVIDDGSSDDTLEILHGMTQEYPQLRVIELAENQGKAVALNTGLMAAKGEYLVCIDGDALLEPEALVYLCAPMTRHDNLGAVTGNPRIRTRSTLVGRIQVGEFSSIIGLIKRTQSLHGRLFTVSGVVAAFRKSALLNVGQWSPDMITEDIDISWKLQRAGWSIRYEPRALCWILMPETLKGLWKQRLRWAQGGAEVFLKNVSTIYQWNYRSLWPLASEYLISVFWVFAYALSIILPIIGLFVALPENMHVQRIFPPAFTGMVLCITCLVQFTTSLIIERRYEPHFFSTLFTIVWYPLVFWMLSFLTSLVSFPKVMLRLRKRRARWETDDRGINRT